MLKKRIIVVVGCCLLLLLILIASIPVWFPWVFGSVARGFGLRYTSYERSGYSHFILHGVRYQRGPRVLSAREVKLLLPNAWVWNLFITRTGARDNFIAINDWRLDITPQPKATPPYVTAQRLHTATINLRKWLPKAALGRGRIVYKDVQIDVPAAIWDQSSLHADLHSAKLSQDAVVEAEFGSDPLAQLRIQLRPLDAEANFTIKSSTDFTATNQLDVMGQITWLTNTVSLSAHFHPRDTIPFRGSLSTKSFRLPIDRFEIDGYEALTGQFEANWLKDHFDLHLVANAESAASNSPPSISVILKATGDTNLIRVQEARIASAWLEAELSKGFTMAYSGQMLNKTAIFHVDADLTKQPWWPVTGRVSGEAFFQRETNWFPEVFFNLTGTNVAGAGIKTSEVGLDGHLAWPNLTIDALDVRFADSSTAKLNAAGNLETLQIEHGTLRVQGKIPRLTLPAGYSYESISATADFSGPWKTPRHSGKLNLRAFTAPKLKPLNIAANWESDFLDFSQFRVTANSLASGEFSVAGAGSVDRNGARMLVRDLTLTTSNQTLVLDAPAPVRVIRNPLNVTNHYSLQIGKLALRGGSTDFETEAAIDWPQQGHFKISAHDLSPALLNTFFEQPFPGGSIDQLEGAADWSNGPAVFGVSMSARIVPPATLHVATTAGITAKLQASGGHRGVAITNLTLLYRNEPVLSGSGQIPITIEPSLPGNSLQLHGAEPIQFKAVSKPNSNFWTEITANTRLRVVGAQLKVGISGTLGRPEGTADFSIKRAGVILSTNRPAMILENLETHLDFTRDQIQLSRLSLLAESHPVSATARLPLPKGWESDWRRALDWRNITGHISAPTVRMASLERLASAFISPQGTLGVNLSLAKGHVTGEITVHDAASRPLPNSSSVQDIEARLKINGRRIEVDRCTALFGGGPVAIFGYVDFARQDPVTHLPVFDVEFRGDSVPLIRRADLILRTHFDLHAANVRGGQPSITGTATLQNSFYLSDVQLLIPSRVAQPENRPPYFSITREPFAGWGVDVMIHGEKFMTVRSPFFNGIVSADFHLTGTLKNPLSLGRIRVDSGVVQFPFANLKVTHGEASLTAASPYIPLLYVTAGSRAYSYDVQMTVHGPADKPIIQFSSMPPLSSEQLLLMLTTGEMPLNETLYSTQQRAGHVALFVGKNILSQLGLGLGTEDRLTIRSGESATEPGVQTYSFQYRLSENWWIIGEYDAAGGVNLGLRWRFYSR